MSRTAHRHAARRASRASAIAVFFMLTWALLALPADQARATGSRNVDQGWRPYVEWHDTATSGGIPRKTTINAFVRAGEQIYLGSSAIGLGARGDIAFRAPDGTPNTCRNLALGKAANYGRILDRAQEVAGPQAPGNPTGYIPCVVDAATTTAAGDGIWQFDLISPEPGAAIGVNPPAIRYNGNWVQSATNHWTSAWDVSVRSPAGAEVPGRVFAKYLAYNLGRNADAARPDLGLDAKYWVVTNDGYGYDVDMNGIDPFGFIFFSNAEGVIDIRGNPTYRSFQLVGRAPNVQLPTGYSVHNPGDPDLGDTGDVTHKIFFEQPDETMPQRAKSASGETWLLPTTAAPPQATNFVFTGVEGTPSQAGTAPLGGNFSFDAPPNINFRITIDISGDGQFGNLNDRVLSGKTVTGSNIVYWDAFDGAGVAVPAGPKAYDAEVSLNVGEVHFPFVDAENNLRGMQLTRFRPATGGVAADRDLIYYNDDFSFTGTSAYDYSPCANGDAPPPPAVYGVPLCFGTPSAQRSALSGVHSTDPANLTKGAHEWSTATAGFGDRRLIDTWTYFPSNPVRIANKLLMAEAELSITKTHAPAQLIPGRQVTYTIQAANAGPSEARAARVQDDIPAGILNPTWSCAITTGTGTCTDLTGSGNALDTTVDLASGAVATYTIRGTVSPGATGSLANTATVRRPNDTTDPDLKNNTAIDNATILPVADLELNKTINTPLPVKPGDLADFSIELRNRGPANATGVEVSEKLPAGLSFLSFTATKGTYNPVTGAWTVGALANNEVAVLSLRATWDGRALKNTAQVSKSDQPDPDSTPGNDKPEEDDQSSASLPVQTADLELTKKVNVGRVDVGKTVVFTVSLTNKGPANATGVRVSDRLPLGLGFVSATPAQGTYDEINGNWAVGSLGAGASTSLQVTATVLGAGPFTNIAQVSGADQYDPDSTPNNDDPKEDDQGFATVGGDLADLSLSKKVSDPQPMLNGTVDYTIVLNNAGPSIATGVAVSEKLPAGLTFVGATPSQGSYNQASGSWQIGSVPVNGSASLVIRARVINGAPIRNTAQVSASDLPDPDSTPGNNDPNEDDQASAALIPQLSDLSLTKVVDNATPNVGGQVTFTIALNNAGPSQATGVEVDEKLPAGLQYVSHTVDRGAYSPATGIWKVGAVSIDETLNLRITVRLAGVGPYTNTAQVSKADQPDPDSTPGNYNPNEAAPKIEDDQGSVTLSGAQADLSLTKRVNVTVLPANRIVTFTLGALNSGPSPATNVTVGERLPAGAVVVAARTLKGAYTIATNTWALGTMAVDEQATLELDVQLNGAGPFVNVAEVTGSDQPDPDSTPNNQVSGEDDQASAVVGLGLAPAEADLRLTKTVDSVSTKLSNGVAYRITVYNDGPDDASGVEVEEKLPAGLRYISNAPSQGSYDPASGIWRIGGIPKNGAASLQLVAVVTADGDIVNTAQVSRSDQFDPDSTPGNSNPKEDDQASAKINRLTAISLLGLRAERQAKGVLVSWETGAELNSIGFRLYRSAGGRGAAVQVTSQLVLARGGAATGASYSFLDSDAKPGVAYSYWLVEVAASGAGGEHGPVRSAALSDSTLRLFLPLLLR